jgi:hypothetical protein
MVKSFTGSIMRNVEISYPCPELVEGQVKPQGILLEVLD